MGENSYNAYYLGVQFGIARVLASVKSAKAWTSVDLAKTNAQALFSAGKLDSHSLSLLTGINREVPPGFERELLGPGGLHDTLVGITENFGSMENPYGTIFHFGFWMGIAEAQASTGMAASVPFKEAAARKAKEVASQLQRFEISPDEISPGFDHPKLEQLRKKFGEIFRQSVGLPGGEEDHLDLSVDALQNDWRYCKKCQGLAFAGISQGVCPAGGGHDTAGSFNYGLAANVQKAAGQHDWRYCKKCQGLAFAGSGNGVCPAGGGHDTAGSWDYSLVANEPAAAGQHDWRYCKKCQGLAFAGVGKGVCPAGGGHDTAGSWDYTLIASAG